MLDDKSECVGVYAHNKLHYDHFPEDVSKTWKYTSLLHDKKDIEYASLYCGGKTLMEVCPEDLKSRLEKILDKLRAFLTAFKVSKISLYDNCFYSLVPERFLLEYCEIKNQITKHVLQNFSRPKNYRFLLSLSKAVEDIRYRSLNVSPQNIKLDSDRSRAFYKKISNTSPYINYDIYGSKTGRLTTRKNSFPILTLDKNYRSILSPKNDYFVELDFNSAEIRTFLALQGVKQPKEDIHAFIAENVFKGQLSRDETKKKFFAWFYNPEAKNKQLEKMFNKQGVLNKYWNGTHVDTHYGRCIEADQKHALNYLIQSTTSDLFLRRMIDVWERLESRRSHIAFSVHDSLVIDYHYEDRDILREIINIFGDTELGIFKVNMRVGENYGKMWTREI
tara:strand:+ start:344 stop:1516 length:1173 start_codon:yes stop_codon:yes gene_type:complete